MVKVMATSKSKQRGNPLAILHPTKRNRLPQILSADPRRHAKVSQTQLERMDRQQCRPCVQVDSNLQTSQRPLDLHRTGHRSLQSHVLAVSRIETLCVRRFVCFSKCFGTLGLFEPIPRPEEHTLHLCQLDSVATR